MEQTTPFSPAVQAGAREMYEAERAAYGELSPPWEIVGKARQNSYCRAFARGLAAMWQRDMTTAPFDEKVTLATSGVWVGDAHRYDKPDGDEWVWDDTGTVVKHELLAWQPLPPFLYPGTRAEISEQSTAAIEAVLRGDA